MITRFSADLPQIKIVSQKFYCKPASYKSPVKNTSPFLWKITLPALTFAVRKTAVGFKHIAVSGEFCGMA
jgi:hypothetical protein